MEFISGPGQPRLQLWQFLLEILNKEEFGSIIRWTNVEPGEFKVIETEEVARLWGLRKGRPNMNYDKLSRSLRYYYDKGILEKVPGQRLVYKFDPELKRRQDQLANTIPGTPIPIAPAPASVTILSSMSISEAQQGSVLSVDTSTLCPPAKKQKIVHGMAPEDIESRGPDAMALFFQAIKEGRKYFRRSRLFLTGPARGGKTSLKRALMGQMFNAQEESTIGVECDLHVCVMEKGQKTAWKLKDLRACKTKEFEKEVAKFISRELKKMKQAKSKAATSSPKGSGSGSPINGHQTTSTEDKTNGTAPLVATALTPTESVTSPPCVIPDEIVSRIAANLKASDTAAARYETDKPTSVTVWDLAGQSLYRILQSSLYVAHAIYTLVVDLSLDFDQPHSVTALHNGQTITLEENREETYLDQIIQCIESIHAAVKSTTDSTGKPVYPIMIIVGTHKDKLGRDRQEVEKRVKTKFAALKHALSGTPYHKYVTYPFFAIDLAMGAITEDPVLEDLRMHIEELVRTRFGQELPLRWLKFDKLMDACRRQGRFYISLEEAACMAKDECSIEDPTEFKELLQFYHQQGVIMHKPNCAQLATVILTKPQWLIGALKRLIHIQLPVEEDQESTPFHGSWQRLQAEGVLEDQLIDHVWTDYSQHKSVLIDLMQKMDLLCPRLLSDPVANQDVSYYMPSLLQIKPNHEEFCESLSQERDSEVLAMCFSRSHLPLDFFSRLLVRCLLLCPFHPSLFRTCARFEIDPDHDLVLLASQDHIKFVVQNTQFGKNAGLPSAAVCVEVLRFITAAAKELKEQWMPGLEFNVCTRHPAPTSPEQEWVELPDDLQWIQNKMLTAADGCTFVPGYTLLLWFENHEQEMGRFVRDCLPYNARVHLAKLFDAPQLPVPDWRSLALYLGFTHAEMAILDQTESPTLGLLAEWEKREMSTLIRLKDKVKLLECVEASELLDSI